MCAHGHVGACVHHCVGGIISFAKITLHLAMTLPPAGPLIQLATCLQGLVDSISGIFQKRQKVLSVIFSRHTTEHQNWELEIQSLIPSNDNSRMSSHLLVY